MAIAGPGTEPFPTPRARFCHGTFDTLTPAQLINAMHPVDGCWPDRRPTLGARTTSSQTQRLVMLTSIHALPSLRGKWRRSTLL